MNKKTAGNILIRAGIVLTGGTYEATKQFAHALHAQTLNLNVVNKDQFYDVQYKVIFPFINNAYESSSRR